MDRLTHTPESASASASETQRTPTTTPSGPTRKTAPGADSEAPGEGRNRNGLPTFLEALDLLHSKGALTNLKIIVPER